MSDERVIIAGAGPVGMVAAAALVSRGIAVTVLEAGDDLATESRASTFHPPTLDMLDRFGIVEILIEQGLVAPRLQYRTKRDGVVAEFDFALIADATRHPYRVQCEQHKLTRILLDRLAGNPNFAIEFGCAVDGISQDTGGVRVRFGPDGRRGERRGRWLIGADGARSAVREAAGIEFAGFTWPERFLVVSTPFDFTSHIPDLVSVSYFADPEQWHFLLQIPGLWRAMFPVPSAIPDEIATTEAYVRAQLARVVDGVGGEAYRIAHVTLYRVHQRVAARYCSNRVMLAGDAAHINNPLGGMGMNGGIHDAVDLADRLARMWLDDESEALLAGYERQRRGIALDYVQRQSIENKRNLEARDPAEHTAFLRQLRATAVDPVLAREYLLKVSMIASLRRAAAIT